MAGTTVMEKQHTTTGSPELIDTLNELRAAELAAIGQYMRHHYVVTGAPGTALAGEFKEIAVAEMRHAEKLGERIDYLGGEPTTQPSDIMKADTEFEAMAKTDLATEHGAIRMYKDAIKKAETSGDSTTRLLLEEILADEEDHANTFGNMLGQ